MKFPNFPDKTANIYNRLLEWIGELVSGPSYGVSDLARKRALEYQNSTKDYPGGAAFVVDDEELLIVYPEFFFTLSRSGLVRFESWGDIDSPL